MTHSHRWVEKRTGLDIFYVQCPDDKAPILSSAIERMNPSRSGDCGAQSDELPFEESA